MMLSVIKGTSAAVNKNPSFEEGGPPPAGWREITFRVCEPTEPVEPRMTTFFLSTGRLLQGHGFFG
jgi:hypothetical protein